MSIQIKDFGKTTAGQPVKVGILANDTIEVHILSYGATIQQLLVPDRKGNKVDVVLGYPTVQDYELNTCFLGAVVGRYANRIGGSKFTLYEEEYHVTPNEGKNCLHSGLHGFDKTVFDMGFEGDDTLVLTAASPDGTDGFPGNAELEVRYSLAGAGLMIQSVSGCTGLSGNGCRFHPPRAQDRCGRHPDGLYRGKDHWPRYQRRLPGPEAVQRL